MPETTPKRVKVEVELKGPRSWQKNEPYNKFLIQYTRTETLIAPGNVKKTEGDRTLADPDSLGLNPALLSRCAPLNQAASKTPKATIRDLPPKFPYWGHLIYNSIKEFNASSPNRCRKLVYDLRHGEADHNAWKKLFIEQNQEAQWTTDPEHKRQPIIEFCSKNWGKKCGKKCDKNCGKKYSIIDPPLTAMGKEQARGTKKKFLQLKEHMFPMPKRAYVSPLLRAMQTFEYALGRDPEYDPKHAHKRARKEIIVRPENSWILDELREQKTGNCADILFDEFTSHKTPKRPPPAGPKKQPQAGTNSEECDIESDKAVRERAASLHGKIFGMDESDCIVRVTHSLLIQNNLIGLEVDGGTVLQKFMLAEGGLFAYVVEGKRTNKETAEKWREHNLKTVDGRKNTVDNRKNSMGKRRISAFPNLEAPTTPVVVTIESAILAL